MEAGFLYVICYISKYDIDVTGDTTQCKIDFTEMRRIAT